MDACRSWQLRDRYMADSTRSDSTHHILSALIDRRISRKALCPLMLVIGKTLNGDWIYIRKHLRRVQIPRYHGVMDRQPDGHHGSVFGVFETAPRFVSRLSPKRLVGLLNNPLHERIRCLAYESVHQEILPFRGT